MPANVYFDLTREFNEGGPTVALASGQAVVHWLGGGWSSHFEFLDEKRRRVRCDFFSRPPRVTKAALDALFTSADDPFLVIDLDSLIRMKQTQRAKDYAVIGELATRLPPEREILVTTDPDRVVALAATHGSGVDREAVRAALSGERDAHWRAVELAEQLLPTRVTLPGDRNEDAQ